MTDEAILFTVGEPARLDLLVSVNLEITRTAAARLIENGAVTIDGKTVVKKSVKPNAGAVVLTTLPEEVPCEAQPEDIPVEIVYEDDDVAVVNKPRGMVVHPAPGNPDGTLVNALLWHCRGQLSGINGEMRPGIVHRIDKDTSGLLVVAKTNEAHLGLAAQLEGHRIDRVYRAVCYGGFSVEDGTVDSPIARDPSDRKRMKTGVSGGRSAVTHYRVLSSHNGFSYIECHLETGRTHQIRVHMASIGHPLAGDAVYGPHKVITELEGQCLHAARLSFTHPITGEQMMFFAPLPDYFEKFLKKMQLADPFSAEEI